MLIVGGVIGYAFPHHQAFAQVQTGMISAVTVGKNGAATTFMFTRTGGQPVRVWAPAVWQATPTGAWHTSGLAPCIAAGQKDGGEKDVESLQAAPALPRSTRAASFAE